MKKDKNKIKSLPPFTAALLAEAEKKRWDFDTPGHHSGSFFNLTDEGKIFTTALGGGMFKADISDSSSAIGDPSSHEGVSGEAERLAASVWGSDECFFVLGGTSTSNRICANALLSPGDLVLFDRNNHKSTWQGALLEAGALPVYLSSCRNDCGVIGPILAASLEETHLREEIRKISPRLAEKSVPSVWPRCRYAPTTAFFTISEKFWKKSGLFVNTFFLTTPGAATKISFPS